MWNLGTIVKIKLRQVSTSRFRQSCRDIDIPGSRRMGKEDFTKNMKESSPVRPW